MKKTLNIRLIVLVLFGLLLSGTTSNTLYAQKKTSVRLKLNFIKIMDEGFTFTVEAGARINSKNVTIPDLEILFYNEFDSESELLGKVTTNSSGSAEYKFQKIDAIKIDTTTTFYTIKAVFKGNDTLRKASRSVSFKNADLRAEVIQRDSTYFIAATLTDRSTEQPIINQAIGVQLVRLFMPHQIEEFTVTDENGTIIVPIEEGLPGIDGNLTLEVLLNDSDDYGTVKDVVIAPIGKVIVDESTFDERTMWSPRNKTPIFLLIFPNLLIFGMWGLIIYLIINLFKITKS
jgi:hypothetical protein